VGKFHLYVDAASGTFSVDGPERGLGAMLMQEDPISHEKRVIRWASRRLIKYECNYSAFLLELQAVINGIEYWSTHLWGNPFVLYMDHWPMEKLGTVHTKTLNRLQEKMREFHFEIR
jgi:hypothetical protein